MENKRTNNNPKKTSKKNFFFARKFESENRFPLLKSLFLDDSEIDLIVFALATALVTELFRD